MASDLQFHVEFSTALSGAWIENGVLVSSVPGGDGIVTETWRGPTPLTATPSQFARLRVVK